MIVQHKSIARLPMVIAGARRHNPSALLAWSALILAALLGSWQLPHAAASTGELPIVPTVHPALAPTTAIPVPLIIRADQTSVWKGPDPEQRMLVSGRVVIDVGYRSLRSDAAAIWLTPSRESGESALDVAIFLSGHVYVAEGDRSTSTLTSAPELLVTTRISRAVQLVGNPVPKSEEESPIVRRGESIRMELLNRPTAPPFIPRIVITSTEEALQAGWIARGPNNRIIVGPGEVQMVDGKLVVIPSKPAKPPKPRPHALVAYDEIHRQQVGNEYVTVLRNPYMLMDMKDNSPPLEFRAQNMVLFSPLQKGEVPKGADAIAQAASLVTGVYLEGDVTLDVGEQHVRASRLYYDLTSQRAVMLDATLSTVDKERNIPLYMRADQIRQLSRSEFAAKKATFSSSEFYTPHYSIGAGDIYLQNLATEGEAPNLQTYGYKIQDATINIQGIPVFYWPYLAGDTSKNEIPLRRLRISNSRTYGLTLQTEWDIFSLAGQEEPKGVRADLYADYFGKRGPAAGVDSSWNADDYRGILRSYIMEDHGTDDLGFDRQGIPVTNDVRGRFSFRHQQDLDDGWTLSLEGSYISDPNFLEQFFTGEFDSDKEHETSFYLKKQNETDALSFLGKFTLFDFTATADQVDDQFQTEKRPEIKYWRIGDAFFDTLTYYSESGASDLHTNFTNFTPTDLGILSSFIGLPAAAVPPNVTYRDAYKMAGYTDRNVVRGDTRHEIDLPLQLGDLKVTPYVTGRLTAWDDAFPETNPGDTTRAWGQTGFRSSMAFWKVYSDINSTFWDLHGLRHIIEPQFNAFLTATSQDRDNLQPFDRDVEDISKASGTSFSINQKWQTKRGGAGHWRNVDWLVLNVQWNQFWNKDSTSVFYPLDPLRGFYDLSRPELSLATNSIAVDAVWRVGERARIIGEANYNLDLGCLEQFATGLVVDQTDNLSWFLGNRYVDALGTDEWTVAVDYHLTRKYEFIAAESYDTDLSKNILSSFTIVRRLPRFNTALTVTYNADEADTTVIFTAWPEGFPEMGFGNRGANTDKNQ